MLVTSFIRAAGIVLSEMEYESTKQYGSDSINKLFIRQKMVKMMTNVSLKDRGTISGK